MSTTGDRTRKRRRISPESEAASIAPSANGHPETRAISPSALANPTLSNDESATEIEMSKVCHHEETLRSLHADLDSMRQLITCNICQRYMYEPYTLSCGHTYCYSCLAEWMGINHKKSCPNCRVHVKQEPTPSFLIRQMVLIFVNRTQLLPDGETSEEHQQIAREEADILAKDRADVDKQGGLFKGTFSRAAARAIAVHDTSDHVDRCPNCLHEIEDGWCLPCNIRVRASDADSDESDDSSYMSDAEVASEGEDIGPWDMDGRHLDDISSSSEDDSSDADHDLSGLIEEDVRWESDAGEEDYPFEAVDNSAGPIIVSDVSSDEGDSDDMQPVRRRRLVNRRSAPSSRRAPVVVSSDTDPDSEDAQSPSVTSNTQRVRERVIESDGDDDDDDSSSSAQYESEDREHHNTTAGFSPLQYGSDDTAQPANEALSPGQFERFPIHPPSTSPSESDQDSESNMSGQSGSDDEAGDSDDNGTGLAEPASDEESDGSEQSTATGYSE